MIQIQGLRKGYRWLRGGSTVAVDGLDLEVPEADLVRRRPWGLEVGVIG